MGIKCQSPSCKRQRLGRHPEADAALTTWFKDARSHDIPLSGPILQEKAIELAAVSDFIPSTGWLRRWKARNAIRYRKAHGETKDTDLEGAEKWAETVLPEFLCNYKPEDVYNCNETGLYYRVLPDGTLAARSEVISGGKEAKDRVTILVCANMNGSDKRPLLMIGKSKRPRCFRGVNSLPWSILATAMHG